MKNSLTTKGNLIYTLFVFLVPILPEFTKILGRSCFEYVILLEFVVLIIKKHKIKDRRLLKSIFLGIFIYGIMYCVHGEFVSTITITLDCFLIIIIVYNEITSEEKMNNTFHVLLWGGLLLSIESIFEYFTEYNLFSLIQTIPASESMGAKVLGYRNDTIRVEATFGQPLPFAMYMLFINFICVFLLIKNGREHKKSKFIVKLMYFMSIISIVLTTGRMVLILAIVLQCFFVSSFRSDKRRLIVVFGLMAVIFVAIVSPEEFDFVYTFIAVFNSDFYNMLSDQGQNIAYRLQLFNALKDFITANPLFGMGYLKSMDVSFFIDTPTSSWQAYSIDNNYLVYLVRYGIVGLVADCYVIIWGLKCSLQGYKYKNSKNQYMFKLFSIIFFLYILDLFTVYQMGEQRIFFVLVGVVLALRRMETI